MGEGEDEGSGDEEWNEMEQNGTELKVSRSWPATRRSREGGNLAPLAHRPRLRRGMSQNESK